MQDSQPERKKSQAGAKWKGVCLVGTKDGQEWMGESPGKAPDLHCSVALFPERKSGSSRRSWLFSAC